MNDKGIINSLQYDYWSNFSVGSLKLDVQYLNTIHGIIDRSTCEYFFHNTRRSFRFFNFVQFIFGCFFEKLLDRPHSIILLFCLNLGIIRYVKKTLTFLKIAFCFLYNIFLKIGLYQTENFRV